MELIEYIPHFNKHLSYCGKMLNSSVKLVGIDIHENISPNIQGVLKIKTNSIVDDKGFNISIRFKLEGDPLKKITTEEMYTIVYDNICKEERKKNSYVHYYMSSSFKNFDHWDKNRKLAVIKNK
jgi:hypothetical protein